jgi:hypothetical protein
MRGSLFAAPGHAPVRPPEPKPSPRSLIEKEHSLGVFAYNKIFGHGVMLEDAIGLLRLKQLLLFLE